MREARAETTGENAKVGVLRWGLDADGLVVVSLGNYVIGSDAERMPSTGELGDYLNQKGILPFWLFLVRLKAGKRKGAAMQIVMKEEGAPTVFALEGRLDTTTSPQLEEFAGELYAKGVADIVVEMGKCDFVSSAGLRVIVAMQKRATTGGSLKFRGVLPEVMDVFTMTGFDKILTFE